jgi:hypothetical protein
VEGGIRRFGIFFNFEIFILSFGNYYLSLKFFI